MQVPFDIFYASMFFFCLTECLLFILSLCPASGVIEARPGILELMDEAKAAGIPVAVCSAATKAACVFVVSTLLGPQRYGALDLFLAGDDVPVKKPDPTIYLVRKRGGAAGRQSAWYLSRGIYGAVGSC